MKPDFVHVHFVGWSLPATLAAYAMGSRVIWHLHSAMRERPGWIQSARTFLKYRALGAGVRTFVVVSELLREGLVDLGIDADRIAVIRNAVDAQHFHPPTAHERSQARQALGLGDGDRALLFFGRDVEVKGADILWNALDDCEPVVLVGVGLPPKAVREFEARGRTIVVPFAADVAPLFWAADALVMPSRREGAPYTMLEALCTGLPVIAGNIPPIAEIARESACVELVNNEPAALSRALRAHAMRRSASTAQVRARLGLDRWVAEVAGLYAA